MSDGTNLMRKESGIKGMDEIIEGGFPFPSSILVAGGIGCGKTIFALQFLFEGAKKGEQGLYFTTFSEPVQWMMKFSSRFSFIDRKLIGNKVKYVDLGTHLENMQNADEILDIINREVEKTLPQRVVIDPINVIKNVMHSDYRIFLYKLSASMKNWNAVTILTGEIEPNSPYPLTEAYTMDGVILLTYSIKESKGTRDLEVIKMRGTNHVHGEHRFEITEDGIVVYPTGGI